MNMRDITKAALDIDLGLSEKSGVESVFYGEIEPSRIDLVLNEPDVFLKASGIKVPDNAEIQVSALSKNRLRQPGSTPARRVVVVVIIFGPIVIVIVVF